MSKVAIIFATMNRPHTAQRLINSIRGRFPEAPIYVADQSHSITREMMLFYGMMNVSLVRLPFDVGVTTARNRLVEVVKEEYFVLCDDDFIFSELTSFEEPLEFLHDNSEFGIVGGHLMDFWRGEFHSRHWELYMMLDKERKRLTCLPIDIFSPEIIIHRGRKFYQADAVMNFAVMKKSIFNDVVKWDERFKSNGEHEDFYLNIKYNSDVKVAYFPGMTARHDHPENFGYKTYRSRVVGWRLFFHKWRIEEHFEFGLGLRTLASLGEVKAVDDVKADFFASAPRRVDRSGYWGEDILNVLGPGKAFANDLSRRDQFGTVPPVLRKPIPAVSATIKTSSAKSFEIDAIGTAIESTSSQTVSLPKKRKYDPEIDFLRVSYLDKLGSQDDFILFVTPFSMRKDVDLIEADICVRWYAGRHWISWEMMQKNVLLKTGLPNAVLMPRPALHSVDEIVSFDLCISKDGPSSLARVATGVVRNIGTSLPHNVAPASQIQAFSFPPVRQRRVIARAMSNLRVTPEIQLSDLGGDLTISRTRSQNIVDLNFREDVSKFLLLWEESLNSPWSPAVNVSIVQPYRGDIIRLNSSNIRLIALPAIADLENAEITRFSEH